MSITSFGFLVFIAMGAIIYYIIPKRVQWIWLLVLSILFYGLAATPYTIVFLCISTVLAYAAGFVIEKANEKGNIAASRVTAVVALAVVINAGIWFLIKGSDLWVGVSYIVHRLVPAAPVLSALPIASALGMGYYTLQVIGYILDCYWGTSKPQKNIFKLFLFVGFFPQLTTGPISRYNELQPLYEPHRFSYENVTHGAQRILWGFMKKLVLAERVAIIVNAIWASPDIYTCFWHWAAVLLYPIQMYADFSGCADIVLGTAEIFGIKLPENFRNPFFSRTIQEFWQRWHITLGAWAKDYVLYPLLKTRWMVKLGRRMKKRFGKRIGKFIPTCLGMFALWMVMGIWHGSLRYIVGVSLWYWLILMLGEFCEPALKKIKAVLNVDETSFSWHLFQSARTYLLYALGAVFFRASGIREGVSFFKSLFSMFIYGNLNPWIFFNGSILELGVTYVDLNIIVFSVLLLIIVGVLREKYGYARSWMDKQFLVFRWIVWLGLFIFVLIYGKYGPGYSAEEFIYQGF